MLRGKPPRQLGHTPPTAGPSTAARPPRQRHLHGGQRQGSAPMAYLDCHVGMDFGTSGARLTLINDEGGILADHKRGYGGASCSSSSEAWERVLFELIADLAPAQRARVASIAIDGTSATAMLVDGTNGRALHPPKMYNEAQAAEDVAAAQAISPPSHTATASTSTLCKVLAWRRLGALREAQQQGQAPRVLHQADWLASLLHGQLSTTDWNNALKLGFDPGQPDGGYPAWLEGQDFSVLLPHTVVAPGSPIALLTPGAAARTGLPQDCLVCGGTTDSIAAFVASGASAEGQAVTSLGSTLAVKMLSATRVDDAAFGVYSHRLGDSWLVGGASNSGGAVLRSFFTDEQLLQLTPLLQPARPTGLDYYPLPASGERFPINDPGMLPRLEPRPEDDALFLQGILEGIANIEAAAYARLQQMGSSPLLEVLTAGGGATNPKWTQIRQATLGVPVRPSEHGDASYGSALLARAGAQAHKKAVFQKVP